MDKIIQQTDTTNFIDRKNNMYEVRIVKCLKKVSKTSRSKVTSTMKPLCPQSVTYPPWGYCNWIYERVIRNFLLRTFFVPPISDSIFCWSQPSCEVNNEVVLDLKLSRVFRRQCNNRLLPRACVIVSGFEVQKRLRPSWGGKSAWR